MLGWLKEIERTSINENAKIYVFLTWFGRGQSDKSAIKGVKEILERKKMRLEDDYLACYGGRLIIRHGHPNKEDCERALNWVKSKT
ncbi:hypothetical protein GF412_02730 [Candidatus Micrarchaeota archaeon]|nr:hypothetical protein [Candidatus Micrarchaeota archaeon]